MVFPCVQACQSRSPPEARVGNGVNGYDIGPVYRGGKHERTRRSAAASRFSTGSEWSCHKNIAEKSQVQRWCYAIVGRSQKAVLCLHLQSFRRDASHIGEKGKVMKRLAMLVVAGLLAFGAADRPASASTFDLGTLNPGTTSGFVANLGSGIKEFDDIIKFKLTAFQSALIGAITDLSTVLGTPVNSVNFSLDLFAASDPLTSLGHFFDGPVPDSAGLSFSYLNLAAGDYFFRVSGKTAKTGNAYQYRFEVSEVPIPPALLLFATALGGMAMFGYRRRNNMA